MTAPQTRPFGGAMMLVCVHYGRSRGWDTGGHPASLDEIGAAFLSAFPALLMPVIILGGIWTGFFTPTESAAVAVVYGLVVSMAVYRDLPWRELPEVFLTRSSPARW